MHRYPFAVGERVYCCWDHDLPQRNQRFLKGVDAEYFEYIARLHGEQLEGPDRQRAAVALRAAYHHGLETLFSLLGALAQAPDCVPAWLPKCSSSSLRFVVRALSRGSPLLTQVGRQHLTIAYLAAAVHQYSWPDEVSPNATRDRFAVLWQRFADEFLDEHNVAEYNSLKHGFRIAPGGFTLRVGREETYGVRAPEANMVVVGGSAFGSSFYEPLSVIDGDAARHHFRIRNAAHNWSAHAMAQRLQLAAWSINNVVGGLRCLTGAPPDTVRFLRPEDPSAFEDAWRLSVAVTRSNMDLEVDAADVDAVSGSVLRQELEQRSDRGKP